MYESKTRGRCHVYYRHDGARVSPQPFDAPVFRVSGDLKHERSYVALYDPQQLALDLSNGPRGVPFSEVEKAIVTGPLAVQGGQRGPLTPPAVSKDVSDDSRPSPSHQRHNWILGKLTAARVDGLAGHELWDYARTIHDGLLQTAPAPHHLPLSEALRMADWCASKDWSTEHQRAAGIRSGQARRARSAARDKRILDLLDAGNSIRRTAVRLGLSKHVVERVKNRRGAQDLG